MKGKIEDIIRSLKAREKPIMVKLVITRDKLEKIIKKFKSKKDGV